MDDVRLANEMTLDGIARQLEAIRADISGVKDDINGVKDDINGVKDDINGLKGEINGVKGEMAGMRADLKGDIRSLDSRMEQGFRRVDDELNAARIRDEEAHSLLKFGLEAREALRESMESRFDATDKKHDEEIGLLKDVLRVAHHGAA